MFAFVTGLILAAAGVLLVVFIRVVPYRGEERQRPVWSKIVFSLVAAVGVLLVCLSCLTAVQAKFVGVGSTFGHVEQTVYQPGLNFKAPWTDIWQIDATVQTDQYAGDSAIKVRTGDGMETTIVLTNRWQINPDAATTIYQDYRSDDPTEHFRDAVVDSQLKAAVQTVMASYDPIAQLKASGASNSTNVSLMPDVRQVSDAIEKELNSKILKAPDGTPLATIIEVTVSGVNWSASTQDKINAFNTEVANTRVATQKEQTSKAEAAANNALAKSVEKDPNVLVNKCLDTVQAAVDKGYALPAGYTCWPGDGAAVVVPSAAGSK